MVVTFQGKPDQVDAGIPNPRDQMMPSVNKMSGFKVGCQSKIINKSNPGNHV